MAVAPRTCVSATDEARAPVGRSRNSDVDRFLGHRIKQLRLMTGMTQRQVAQQLGVSSHQVHKFEKGIDRLSASQLTALARAFEVAVGSLFDGYRTGAPLEPPHDPETSRLLLEIARSFLELGPKHQGALVRLARALAAED
jgi:transcriptional regulator with XRE-family HTH domain